MLLVNIRQNKAFNHFRVGFNACCHVLVLLNVMIGVMVCESASSLQVKHLVILLHQVLTILREIKQLLETSSKLHLILKQEH